MASLSDKAKNLIFSFEGLDQASDWPGGDSGITIGIGYDLGYVTADEFAKDWSDILVPADLQALNVAVGLKAEAAKEKAPLFKTIRIKMSDAERVFLDRSVPTYAKQTANAFPGLEKLPDDAQGALISLVYNRGPRLTDRDPKVEDRREMRAIRDAVAKGDLQTIADQLRAMKRLWEGKHQDGLLKRRDAEADLVASCIVKPPAAVPNETESS
jgi:GH24 family phage-related lysozyme (muramidase)